MRAGRSRATLAARADPLRAVAADGGEKWDSRRLTKVIPVGQSPIDERWLASEIARNPAK